VLAAIVDGTVGIVGANGLGTTAPLTMGNTLGVGTAGAELTPRLLISIEPNGIPVRAAPPAVAGDVDVDVGIDEEVTLLEPEPHIPDMPDVSGIPGVVDIPDVADIPDNVDGKPVEIDPDDIDVDMLPVVVAVAGAAVPAAVPPPSKLAVDPNIPDSEVPMVEHAVATAPLVGIAMVPVTPPVGVGLTPSDEISVESSGIPAGEAAEGTEMPSGEVAPIVSAGAVMSSTCAMAALPTRSAGRNAAINTNLISILRLKPVPVRRAPASIGFATISLGARLSDIGQSLVGSP
jgi:hypothetical protein